MRFEKGRVGSFFEEYLIVVVFAIPVHIRAQFSIFLISLKLIKDVLQGRPKKSSTFEKK